MPQMIANRYEVLDQLGSGVLGEVVKVRDRETGEVRAVKLFKPRVVSPSNMGRFEREFAAISRMSHPNIVQVFDFGVHEERPFFTMELLEGSDLRVFVQRERPPEGDAPYADYVRRLAYVFHQICDALDTVHAAGIVHRDLKPENIFVRPGRFPRAKLLDFGHAKEEDSRNLTITGTVLGTSFYLAPEQAMGRAVGAPADLYAIGCVLHESLTGRPPFGGATVMEVILAHIQREPVAAREVDPRVPEPLSDLCRRLMRKEPAERPTCAEASVVFARY